MGETEILAWLDAEAKLYDEQGMSADYEHSCKLEATARLIRSQITEVREREANIEWWRERYNNLVELNGLAIEGRLDSDDDVFMDKTEYPLSDGAKSALYKIIEAVRDSGIQEPQE